MIASLLLRLVPFKGAAILIAIAAIVAVIGGEYVEIQHLHTTVATGKAEFATARAAAASAALAASEKIRALEEIDAQHQKEATDALQHDRDANARVISSLRSELDGVRHRFADFASGRSAATPDTVEACERRAGALGDVLAEALRVQGELAGDAEGEAAGARSLLEAWPVK